MQQTTNYQLPQWEAGDRIRRGDFNDMAQKIDTALKANAAAVGALGTPLKFETGFYTGNGAYSKDNMTRIDLSIYPLLVFIWHYTGNIEPTTTLFRGMNFGPSTNGRLDGLYWEDKGMRWYSSSAETQMNVQNHKYYYFAIGYDV